MIAGHGAGRTDDLDGLARDERVDNGPHGRVLIDVDDGGLAFFVDGNVDITGDCRCATRQISVRRRVRSSGRGRPVVAVALAAFGLALQVAFDSRRMRADVTIG